MSTIKEHILDLIKAQDLIRRAWAEFDTSIVGKPLREIDKDLTKVINQLGKQKKRVTYEY